MKWVINTKEEYEAAMKELEGKKVLAEMSDDFRCWQSETDWVQREMYEVQRQAREKGLIA